jgi:hypothetical protein
LALLLQAAISALLHPPTAIYRDAGFPTGTRLVFVGKAGTFTHEPA